MEVTAGCEFLEGSFFPRVIKGEGSVTASYCMVEVDVTAHTGTRLLLDGPEIPNT